MNDFNVKITSIPNYNTLSSITTITYPEADQLIISKDLRAAEERFKDKRNVTGNEEYAVCYDTARAVCRLAMACNGTLKYQIVKNELLSLDICFFTKEELQKFEDNLGLKLLKPEEPQENSNLSM